MEIGAKFRPGEADYWGISPRAMRRVLFGGYIDGI